MVYATDHSKAVVWGVIIFMGLCGFLLRAIQAESFLALCFVFVSRFSIVITSLEEERAGLCASRSFEPAYNEILVLITSYRQSLHCSHTRRMEVDEGSD